MYKYVILTDPGLSRETDWIFMQEITVKVQIPDYIP
jgi:hypothetical protein